jgi:hypothetical protein
MASMHRLILGLALLISSFVGSAQACSLPSDWSEQKDFDKACYVFHALVTATVLNPFVEQRHPEIGRALVDVTYELKSALKGKPEATGTVSTTSGIFGGCGVPVLAGQEYVFFIVPFPKDMSADAVSAVENSKGNILDTVMLPFDPKEKDRIIDTIRKLAK